ncbi:MAG: peptide chain release factor N(5)-glutamine methyltransferase [Dehalococcoidia bacterium]|nr:peptide chain release factor N(5)-glutamine methyltransferase [Dehalococcoidia bacterium]
MTARRPRRSPAARAAATPAPPRLAARLHDTAQRLLAARASWGRDEARLEAELLYAEAAGWDRAKVIAEGAAPPDASTLARFEALLARRLAHEPLAYILGRREFYGLTFEVGPGVLIPRPETETLVEATLAAIAAHRRARRRVRVADVGTGSGAVALAVARHAPSAEVTGIDASTEALAWAGRNRAALGLVARVVLLAGDLLEPVTEPLDVVAANLPYIPTEEYEALPAEIRKGEPRLAVDGGEDGLDAIRALVAQLPAHLAPDAAAALFEVGAGQAGAVAELLASTLGGEASAVRTHRDLSGTRRVVEWRRGY